MFNLSLTACSFHLKKSYSRDISNVYNLNEEFSLSLENGRKKTYKNVSELFVEFLTGFSKFIDDEDRKQTFSCEYKKEFQIDTPNYYIIYTIIHSGIYGSSSDIIDRETQELKYPKTPDDVDTRPFYLFIVLPKNSGDIKVQKGMFIFQNVGPFGVKTITTDYMRDFFAKSYKISLKCRTIAPELFINKVIKRENIRKLVMIKNMKSTDTADNVSIGYGREVRELADLHFDTNWWDSIMDRVRYVAGGKYNLFEFEQQNYDNLKLVVSIGGKERTIDLHNLENLSIIEGIPDEIKMDDGHPNKDLLIRHILDVVDEYLSEMVLEIS